MRFAKQMEYYKIPEWSAYYLDYHSMIKQIYAHHNALVHNQTLAEQFEQSIKSSLKIQFNIINTFYQTKKSTLRKKISAIFENIFYLERNFSHLNLTETGEKLNIYKTEENESGFKRALCDVHRKIWWLEVYCEVNYIAFLRLLDKLDRPKDLIALLEQQIFMKCEEELGILRVGLYEQIAAEFFDGDIDQAKIMILNEGKYYKFWDMALIYGFLGMIITSSLISTTVILITEIGNPGTSIFPSFCVFRLTLAINIIILSWSWIIYMLDTHGLN